MWEIQVQSPGQEDPLLQYSCLENPRDGGAWWAAVYGVAHSRTQLKRLSSSSSSVYMSVLLSQFVPPSPWKKCFFILESSVYNL